MLFSSFEFIFFFLPVMFVVYFYLNSKRLVIASKAWLVGGSLFFYSWWNPIYLPLILSSVFINYGIGSGLGNKTSRDKTNSQIKLKHFNRALSRKTILIAGVVFNIALLGYFKYTDFFIENFNGIFLSQIPLQHIALPLAISFFTFQQIAYLVDSYRGETKEYDFLNYMLFVTFFPQLIAGPIVHHKEMMPQFASYWNLVKRYKNIILGLFVFSLGFFKKVVIADSFAKWANGGFDAVDPLSFIQAWITSLSYTFQLYFDFSGYTDMAIGAALLFNIRLPINFNSPYKALNIKDFWKRWHVTLSRFLRDYVYIYLGGNRKDAYRTYLNLFATFMIGGIWHGAGWMFVIWGALHGIALIIHRLWQKLGFVMHDWLAWFITFNFINITWVFFRAENIDSAVKVLRGMFGQDGFILPVKLKPILSGLQEYGVQFGIVFSHGASTLTMFFIIGILLIVLCTKNSMQLARKLENGEMVYVFSFYGGLLFLFSVWGLFQADTVEFIYFNF